MNAVEFGRQIERRPLRRLETLLRWMDAVDVNEEMRTLLKESIEDLRDVTLRLLVERGEEGVQVEGPGSWCDRGEDLEPAGAEPMPRLRRSSAANGTDAWIETAEFFYDEIPSDGQSRLPQLIEEEDAPDEPRPVYRAGVARADEEEEDITGARSRYAASGGPDCDDDEPGALTRYAASGDPDFDEEEPGARTRYAAVVPTDLEDYIHDGPEADDGEDFSGFGALPPPAYYVLESLEAMAGDTDEGMELDNLVENQVLRLWSGEE